MSFFQTLLSEPVVWVFCAVALISLAIGLLQIRHRKQKWIAAARSLGFTYFDENGKKGHGAGLATPAETDLAKSFSLRCLRGGYHVHVLIGRWEGRQMLVADYVQKKFPKELQTEVQQSSNSSTYRRTVFVGRQSKGSLPKLLLCRNRSYAERLEWLDDEKIVTFPEDPVFDQAFTVTSPEPEKARDVLSAELRNAFMRDTRAGFHLEMDGQDMAIHLGRYLPPEETKAQLSWLADIMQILPPFQPEKD